MEQQEQATPRTLVRKLAEVMALVDRIPKRGRNEFHKYDYAMEADIVDAVRIELAKRHVMMIPSAVDSKSETIGEKGQRVFTLRERFTFMDGESGEQISLDAFGQGADALDKGCYKAMTGALKYALLKTFLIPTGDDPEKDDEQKRRSPPPPSGTDGLKEKVRAGPPPPPPSASAENIGTPASHDRTFKFQFGNGKDTPLHSLKEEDLRFYESALKKNIDDASKANFRARNAIALAQVQAELRFRGKTT